MSGALEHALDLAARGFWIFPLRENGKKPARKGWQDLATRNPERIAKWFTNHRYNVGIYTGKFGDGTQAVVAIDVDVKGSKHGDQTLLLLDMEGLAFPETLRHGTPTGGSHILVCDEPLRQGVDVPARASTSVPMGATSSAPAPRSMASRISDSKALHSLLPPLLGLCFVLGLIGAVALWIALPWLASTLIARWPGR